MWVEIRVEIRVEFFSFLQFLQLFQISDLSDFSEFFRFFRFFKVLFFWAQPTGRKLQNMYG